MLLLSLYLVALFVALTPGVLLTLPKGGKRLTVAFVHGLLFAAIWYFTRNAVLRATEGFQARGPPTPPRFKTGAACMSSSQCSSGVCDGAAAGRLATPEVLGTCSNAMSIRCKDSSACKGKQCVGYVPLTPAIPGVPGKCT